MPLSKNYCQLIMINIVKWSWIFNKKSFIGFKTCTQKYFKDYSKSWSKWGIQFWQDQYSGAKITWKLN